MISGSAWFQYKGNHSATYNVLKSVVELGNSVTLVYPTGNYSWELRNAREMMAATSNGLRVIPVNIMPRKINQYYQSGRRFFSKFLPGGNSDRLTSQFNDYLSYELNLNRQFGRVIMDILMQEDLDLVQVDYPGALKIVSLIAKHDIPKIFVSHEIQAIRAQRTLASEEPRHANTIQKIRQVESHFLKQYDAVFTLTAVDSAKLQELYSIDSMVSPHAVNTDFWKKQVALSKNRHLVFSGGESHYPNKDAVEWLCRDIMPMLDNRLGKYKLYITGKWSNATKKKLSSDKTVFTDYVEDLRGYLSGGISLAPIRIGSGMRVKILEAMSMECPVVSTTVGCEGLGVVDGQHLLVADTAEAFADKVVMASQMTDRSNRLGAEARKFVVEHYGLAVTGKRRVALFRRILNQKCKTDCAACGDL